MFTVKITSDIDKAIEAFIRKQLAMRDNLLEAVNQQATFVKSQAQLHLTGEFLRVRTDRLRSSVSTDVERQGHTIYAYIGTNVWYGELWETGRAENEEGKLIQFTFRQPRPWLSKALERRQNKIRQALSRAVQITLGAK